MAGPDDAAQAAARLEAALDRIARQLETRTERDAGPGNAEIAARLDSLIGQLRTALSSTDASSTSG